MLEFVLAEAFMRIHGYSLFGIAGGVLPLVFLSACSGGDRSGNAGPSAGAVASAEVPAGPQGNCPLGAAEVGEVVGVAVRQDATTCMFEPKPGTEPRVLYVRQVSFACSEGVVKDSSFSMEPYDGLGVRAYASPTGGDLLVCTNPPFEITVDITPDSADIVADAAAASAAARASERAAAEQLARRLLAR